MPILSEFKGVADNTSARTVTLSGYSSALLFSAVAAISSLSQWDNDGGLSSDDIDEIEAIIANAMAELMDV